MVVASDWGTGQVFLEMLYFFLFIIWIWLLIIVFADIFRSHDMGGFAKAIWVIFVIILPYLGVFVYLIARGHKMAEHAQQAAASPERSVHPSRPAGRGNDRQHRRRARTARGPQGERHDHRRRVRAGEGQGAQQLSVRHRGRPCSPSTIWAAGLGVTGEGARAFGGHPDAYGRTT